MSADRRDEGRATFARHLRERAARAARPETSEERVARQDAKVRAGTDAVLEDALASRDPDKMAKAIMLLERERALTGSANAHHVGYTIIVEGVETDDDDADSAEPIAAHQVQ